MLSPEYTTKRNQYMANEITHHEFYMWVASELHIGWPDHQDRYMGRTVEEWAKKYQSDEWLNNVPLREFDALHYWYVQSAGRKHFHNSLSDNTCTHKAVIKDRVLKYLASR